MVKRALAILLLTLTTLVASNARADHQRDISVWMLGSPLYDAGFVALNAAGLVIGTKVLHPLRRDRAPLDGHGHRPRVEALGRAGDVAVVIGLITGAGLSYAGELGSEARGLESFRGPVVTLEGALFGSMVTQVVKNFFGVCRPRDWDDLTRKCTTRGEGRDDESAIDEAHRSFPSGHSAPLAGMAGAALGMYLLPTTPRREHLAVALTSVGFAMTIVVLRVRAGAHSWADTGAAFLSGGLAGFAVAALHLKVSDHSSAPSASAAPMIFSVGAPF